MIWPPLRDSGWVGRFEPLLRARVAPAVALALLLGYALVAMAGGVERMAWWYLTFGLQRQQVLAGEIWQLASYGLLHGNWHHVMLNGLIVWVLGARVEHVLGKAGLLKLLGWGVLGGAAGHLLLGPATDGGSPLVGISAGCMALLLAITTLSPDSRMFPLPVSGRSLGLGVMSAELGFALLEPGLGLPGLGGIGGWLVRHGWGGWFQVGHACHFGGCLAGWLVARAVLRPRVTLATLRAARRRRENEQMRPAATRGPRSALLAIEVRLTALAIGCHHPVREGDFDTLALEGRMHLVGDRIANQQVILPGQPHAQQKIDGRITEAHKQHQRLRFIQAVWIGLGGFPEDAHHRLDLLVVANPHFQIITADRVPGDVGHRGNGRSATLCERSKRGC